MNPLRSRLLLALIGITFTAAASHSADTKPNWDPVRTTFPASTGELKALQDTVKQVVDKTTPATIAVLVGNGAGSGVFVTDGGLILTAAHVIGWPDQDCLIVLPDGKRVRGKTLGVNHNADSGMLKVTDAIPKGAKWDGVADGKWPVVEVAKSSDVKQNQWVVALGHPGGPKRDRRPPVRVGQFLSSGVFRDSVSSDCTLVGGDSGGPLFDLTGKLIGIHSRIGLTLDQNIHVTTNAFQREWDKLADGVTTSDSRFVIGVNLKRKDKAGDANPPAEVLDLTKDGPAEKAGLKVGDVITRVGLVTPERGAPATPPTEGDPPGRMIPVPSSEAFDGIVQVLEREGGGGGFGGGRRNPLKLRVEVKRESERKTIEITTKVREAQKPRGPASPDKN